LLEIAIVARYGASEEPNADLRRMTDTVVPHFHNDVGVPIIEIGATEFMCVGALPPFDHPHVYCDMGDDREYVCPYCSTLYRHDPALNPHQARPAECALNSPAV
jgi:uncharacterized Zn-finger protein